MSRVKRWIRDWLREDNTLVKESSATIGVANRSIDQPGFNLRVYRANGGTVIETQAYDTVKDRHYNKLYVVTEDKDLGSEIGKIITMENLRV